MRSRRNGFVTIAMAAALWAWSGGVASAQCDGPCPSPIVVCDTPVPPSCDDDIDAPCPPGTPPESITCTGFYTPDQRANVFTFGNNNSIQVKFDAVTCSGFFLDVTLTPTTQEVFQTRVTHEDDDSVDGGVCTFDPDNPPYPPNPDITCNETVIVGAPGEEETFCAVYTVGPPPATTCYTQGPKVVGYTIGWLDPEVKGNKHDYMLLRDPDGLHPSELGEAATTCFSQDITDRLLRNYTVGTIVDPGLGGRTCCTSDYVVAKQRVRPVRK